MVKKEEGKKEERKKETLFKIMEGILYKSKQTNI